MKGLRAKGHKSQIANFTGDIKICLTLPHFIKKKTAKYFRAIIYIVVLNRERSVKKKITMCKKILVKGRCRRVPKKAGLFNHLKKKQESIFELYLNLSNRERKILEKQPLVKKPLSKIRCIPKIATIFIRKELHSSVIF